MIDIQREQVTLVPVSSLNVAGWNPRLITTKRFEQLCQSLQNDPDFLWLRPICATSDGTVYAGNQRLRAAIHLGWSELPAIVGDVSKKLAKERALRDNNAWGDWQDEERDALLYELEQEGSDISLLGFDDALLDQYRMDPNQFQPVGEDEQGRLDERAKVTCPECGHEFSPS